MGKITWICGVNLWKIDKNAKNEPGQMTAQARWGDQSERTGRCRRRAMRAETGRKNCRPGTVEGQRNERTQTKRASKTESTGDAETAAQHARPAESQAGVPLVQDHRNEGIGTCTSLRTHRDTDADRDDYTADCNQQEGKRQWVLPWENTGKQDGLKVRNGTKAEYTEGSPGMNLGAREQQEHRETEHHRRRTGLAVTQAGLAGHALHKDHKGVCAYIQCDE